MVLIIKTLSGKEIESPGRMLTEKDLEDMGYDFVKGKIFFYKIPSNGAFNRVDDEKNQNMAIVLYRDFSDTPFSIELLRNYIDEQIRLGADFIFLPYFKNEEIYDIKKKVHEARKLKAREDLKKEIVLEISYKSEIVYRELARLSEAFDSLSIFYGTYYGQYPHLVKIADRILSFKALTGKRVFCTATPMKFAGDNVEDCRLMPCFSLISDFWIKNWKPARKGDKIKLVDEEDFRSKTYFGWTDSGHSPNQIMASVNMTIKELFSSKNEKARKEYEKILFDEILLEIDQLTPQTVENFVNRKFPGKYFKIVTTPFSEKIIQELFRNNDVFSSYEDKERLLLEGSIRKWQFSPSRVEECIRELITLVKTENPPISVLVNAVENFGL